MCLLALSNLDGSEASPNFQFGEPPVQSVEDARENYRDVAGRKGLQRGLESNGFHYLGVISYELNLILISSYRYYMDTI